MKKVLVICLCMIVLNGCASSKNNVTYKDMSQFNVTEHTFGETQGVYGYVMDFHEKNALIIGMNIDDKHKQLNATYVNVEYQELLNSDTEIGTKVKYINDGLGFSSYPGIGGIKVVKIIEVKSNNASSSEAIVIQKAIKTLRKMRDKDSFSLYCINDSVCKDELWEIKIVEDISEGFNYYKVYISDDTLNVEEIIVYK